MILQNKRRWEVLHLLLFIFSKFAVFSACAVFLSACAEQNARLTKDLGRLEASVNDVRAFQAEQTSKIQTLETELRALEGRLEELEFGKREKWTAADSLPGGMPGEPGRPPPIVPLEALEDDEIKLTRVPSELAEPLHQAFTHIRSGGFNKALSYLEEVSYLSVGTEWAPLALFWRAVVYDGLNETSKALTDYHTIVTRHPKYGRVSLVLLRQASLLIRLGDTKAARIMLNKLISQFPKSSEASRARERLKDL